MVKKGIVRIAALVLTVLLLMPGRINAELALPQSTTGQKLLADYISTVNTLLDIAGEKPINSVFDIRKNGVELGITDTDNAEVPEKVEITAELYEDAINTVEVRVCDEGRFPRIAAAFIQALSPKTITADAAMKEPVRRLQKVRDHPESAFADIDPDEQIMNGENPFIYYFYYPNRYYDGNNWMVMIIAFPVSGYWDGQRLVTQEKATPAPGYYGDDNPDFDGYYPDDGYMEYHAGVTETSTPEPDSPASWEYFIP